MNNTAVQLPFRNLEILQKAGGHPVTDAAAILQQTILENTQTNMLTGLELGSGNGIISLMLALQRPEWNLSGIEIQSDLVTLARQNNASLGLHCTFQTGDIRTYELGVNQQAFDLVFANPPWVKAGSGKVSPDMGRALSRQEINCTITDVLACVDRCLNQDGTAWLIYPNLRQSELISGLAQTDLALDELIHPRQNPSACVGKLKRKAASRHH